MTSDPHLAALGDEPQRMPRAVDSGVAAPLREPSPPEDLEVTVASVFIDESDGGTTDSLCDDFVEHAESL